MVFIQFFTKFVPNQMQRFIKQGILINYIKEIKNFKERIYIYILLVL